MTTFSSSRLNVSSFRFVFIVLFGLYGFYVFLCLVCIVLKYVFSNNFGGLYICIFCVVLYIGLKKCIVFCLVVNMSCCDINCFSCCIFFMWFLIIVNDGRYVCLFVSVGFLLYCIGFVVLMFVARRVVYRFTCLNF